MDEIEEEEYIKQKYVRDDEDPVPWDIEKLALPPYASNQLGYYPLSTFSIFKNIIRSNDVLKFPEFMWVSKNHYNLQWTLDRTLRRLKNVIVVMEWEPSTQQAPRSISDNIAGALGSMLSAVGLAGGQFTIDQEGSLLRCFSMFDMDEDGLLNYDDIGHVSADSLCTTNKTMILFIILLTSLFFYYY